MRTITLIKPDGLRRLLAMAVVLLLPVGVAAQDNPEEFIRKLAQEAIELSRSNVQAEQLERLLDRSTDIPLVGRLVLGRYWRAAGDEQRQDYLALFRGYVLAGITRRLGGAKGIEKVEVTDSQPASGRDSMVATMITLGNGAAPSRVEWRVRQKGASYRIVDVVVEGVSLVVTNRDQFAAIVAESGMDGLLRELRDWSTRPAEQRPAA
jgi:phospholipid transport system substrate-binding protein